MYTIAAATVPSDGSPEKANARKSNQWRSHLSLTPAASSTADQGPESSEAFSPMRGSAIAPMYGPAVSTAPRSARSASGGTASTARCSGSMNSTNVSHWATVASPSPSLAIVRRHSPMSPAVAKKSPSGVYMHHRSYCSHSGDSPTASSTCRIGLVDGAAQHEVLEPRQGASAQGGGERLGACVAHMHTADNQAGYGRQCTRAKPIRQPLHAVGAGWS